MLYMDGKQLNARLILISSKGDVLQYALHFTFRFTSNEVEYETLISILKISKELGIHHLKTYSDSAHCGTSS